MTAADTGLELLIGRVLRFGVAASTLCLAAGIGTQALAPAIGDSLLKAGLIILLMTPGARVGLSIVEYVIARDWTFVFLTMIVMLELIGGAVAAAVFHKHA